MINSSTISIMMVGMMACLVAILSNSFPFYTEALGLIAISLVVMALLHEKFLFLYAITVTIGFGAFLTGIAFWRHNSEDQQISFMFLHLLVTTFLLLYWILLYYIKSIGTKNRDLIAKVKALEKYMPHSNILTNHEFLDQAKIILKGTERRNEQAWLLQLCFLPISDYTKQSVRETLEKLALHSIRVEYDIVTSSPSSVMVLLQNTNRQGVEIVKKRMIERANTIFNKTKQPFLFKEQLIDNVQQAAESLEEKTDE
ncbi:hypothetical protein P4T04_20105 [Bacillus badius]|uniref:hypothetical protein n=1 Tax=Bacillus badius TaxID=1455 RepID=UPI002E20862C|nr:hypothetical protein [Bacillus badius]